MKTILLLSLVTFSGYSSAQPRFRDFGPVDPPNSIANGDPFTHIPTKRLISYEYVREADVMWSKRVWRTIDKPEKINHPIFFPYDQMDSEGAWITNNQRWSLWTIIRFHVLKGNLTMFSPYNPYQFQLMDGDQFKYPVVPEYGKSFVTDEGYRQVAFQYLGKLGEQQVIPYATIDGEDSTIINSAGVPEYVYPPRDTVWFMAEDIVQYRIKEDWFFDKERSVMDSRILGIAPVIYDKDVNGQILGLRELFWLYFPSCRHVFVNYYVFNEQNDAQWMSFDDLFWKRQFSSTIYKESNVFDRKIESFRTGVDALIESEKITEEIRTFEHDVWNF